MADRLNSGVADPQDQAPPDQEHGQSAASGAARTDAEDQLRALARQAAREAWAKSVGHQPNSETSS